MYTVTIAARISKGSLDKRILKSRRRALKAGVNAGRKIDVLLRLLDGLGGVAQRDSRRQIERKRHHRELSLVIDRQRRYWTVSKVR